MRRWFYLLVTIALLVGSWQPLLAQADTESSGRLRLFSRTQGSGKEKAEDTFILWSNSTVQPEERFETVVVLHGKSEFYGKAKELVVLGGEVTLHDGAEISERLVVLGGKLHKRDGARISEQVLFELPQNFPRWLASLGPFVSFFSSGGAQLLGIIVRAVMICLFGALLYLIAPELMKQAEEKAVQAPLPSLFWSVLAALAFLPGIAALVISLIGIFLIPLYVMCFAFVFYFVAYVMTANILGHNLPPRRSHVMPPLRFFYGVFILVLFWHVPLLGPLAIYAAMSVTGGAMLSTLWSRVFRKNQRLSSA